MKDKTNKTPAISSNRRPGSFWRDLLRRMDAYRGVIALAAVILAGIVYSPIHADGTRVFLLPEVHVNLLRSVSEFGILAAGMTFVILAAGIDLSVGSVLAFSSMIFMHLLIKEDTSAAVAVAGGLGIGIACGIANGLIISRLRLQPFVVTLAMMVFARGAARVISSSEKIQTELRQLDTGEYQRHVPGILHAFGGRLWPDAPWGLDQVFVVTVVFLAVIFIGHILLSRTGFGRQIYAIGGNEEAARFSGVRVNVYKTAAYAICGGLAGLAGVFNAAQVQMGDPSAGLYRELDAIAAVVIGGTMLVGGRGGMLFTLLGVLIIGYIDVILSLNSVADPWRLMSKGMIIVAAVLIQQRRGV